MKELTENLRKLTSSLKIKSKRDEAGIFVAEGEKLCQELILAKQTPEYVVIRSRASETALSLAGDYEKLGIPVYLARSRQFDGLCDTKSPQDILAVVRMNNLQFKPNTAFIALDGIADPGNFGTIIRTADWFGFKQIITGSNSVDKYNSKVVRASMGSLFRIKIFEVDNLAGYLKNELGDFDIFGADLMAPKSLEDIQPKDIFGVVLGSEAHGISQDVKRALTDTYKITGLGRQESLNVAVAAGISMYYFSRFL